jgi:short-subunit dehydrogenase
VSIAVEPETPRTASFVQERRIVITGAGRGLGRALAIVTADYGAKPVLLGRDSAALGNVAETIRDRSGYESQIVPCDLAKPTDIRSACDAILSKDPNVDVLINNGAPWLEGRLDEFSDEEITNTVSAAVSGAMLVTKGLLPGLRRSKCADIITIVSTSGIPAWDLNGSSTPFHAAKHGQSGFSEKMRHELKGTGIRVSTIFPSDFADADPADANWSMYPDGDASLSSREIVSTLLYMLTAPRTCSFPVVVLESMQRPDT